MSVFLFLPYLPLFFSAEWSHLLLCGPIVPLVQFNGKISEYFSFCMFFFAPSLSQLTVSSLSEDHFIPNFHVYYNINNVTTTKTKKRPSEN